MTGLRLRPVGLRVPWQVIAGFAVLVYVIRSIMRSWEFRPDLLDLVVFGGLALLLAARPLVGRLLDGGTDDDPGKDGR
ncbi:MAG TPA: hypothetical protein VIK83_03440 [Coriobacteriia bacterium]